jgi:hypothetical protein
VGRWHVSEYAAEFVPWGSQSLKVVPETALLLIEAESANSYQESSLRFARVAQESGLDGNGYRHAHAWHWRHHSHLHGGLFRIARAVALPRAQSAGDGLVESQRAQ